MKTKMKTMRASVFQAAVLVMLLVVALSGCTIGGSTSTPTPTASSSTPTASSIGGGLIEQEVRCSQQLKTPGYYSSINPALQVDALRSQLYPCADFLGSRTGPNQVSAQMSKDSYQGTSFLNNRKPGELYLVGGDAPPATGLTLYHKFNRESRGARWTPSSSVWICSQPRHRVFHPGGPSLLRPR
jgi:hypothetical protein